MPLVYQGQFQPGTKGVGRGNRGAWNTHLCLNAHNHPSYLPLSAYRVGNYTYCTDAICRVFKVSGELILLTQDRHTTQQRKVGKLVNPAGDQGGHLIASILGGAGEAINMVPMRQTLNQGDWKRLENQWSNHLRAHRRVHVKIVLIYNGLPRRPSQLSVYYSVSGLGKFKCTFNN